MSNFLQAARNTDSKNRLPHQDAAWQWAWEQLSEGQRKQFLEMFRADPPEKAPLITDWGRVAALAQKAGAKHPDLVAAQWALESGWGKHVSGKHNYFGLKGTGSSRSTQEFINGRWVSIVDQFLDFGGLEESVQYLVNRWYKDFDGYKGINRAPDRTAAARELVKQGYATDPGYAAKLIELMDKNAPVAKPSVALKPSSPFSSYLTEHIQLGEFALYQEVRRFKQQHQVDTALLLARFLEEVRTQFGGHAVVITSGYRPPEINRSIGGASSSEHLYDAPGVGAVDFYVEKTSIQLVQAWCDRKWPYSLGYGAPKGFVHLGIRQGSPRVRWDY